MQKVCALCDVNFPVKSDNKVGMRLVSIDGKPVTSPTFWMVKPQVANQIKQLIQLDQTQPLKVAE